MKTSIVGPVGSGPRGRTKGIRDDRRRFYLPILSWGLLASTRVQADLPSVDAAMSPSSIKAGVHETLLLAVSSDSHVIGHYREQQRDAVTRTCTFFLGGYPVRDGGAIRTWKTQAYPGALAAVDGAVKLTAANGDQHPGCGLVLLPSMATEGVELSQTLARPWIE